MTDQTANFEVKNVAFSDFQHPLLKRVRFIFADDKPNGNNQGIEYEDFEIAKQTAINMPIKMRYLGTAGAGGHTGSVTIGHITDMTEETLVDGTHQLIGDGVLYKEEYPKEVEYLETAHAEGKAPRPSFEIVYGDVKKDGTTEWLKNFATSAVAFVRNAAYGTRTSLLALASDQNISDAQFNEELIGIIEDIRPKNDTKGGSNTVEEELKKLREDFDALKAENDRLTKENGDLVTAKAELETQVDTQGKAIAEFQRAQLVTQRTTQVAEAGLVVPEDQLERKQTYWVSLSEEAFNEYIEDIKTLKAQAPKEPEKKAIASLANLLPRPSTSTDVEKLSIDDLKESFRAKGRGVSTD